MKKPDPIEDFTEALDEAYKREERDRIEEVRAQYELAVAGSAMNGMLAHGQYDSRGALVREAFSIAHAMVIEATYRGLLPQLPTDVDSQS